MSGESKGQGLYGYLGKEWVKSVVGRASSLDSIPQRNSSWEEEISWIYSLLNEYEGNEGSLSQCI